jgi:hypothetical protein
MSRPFVDILEKVPVNGFHVRRVEVAQCRLPEQDVAHPLRDEGCFTTFKFVVAASADFVLYG